MQSMRTYLLAGALAVCPIGLAGCTDGAPGTTSGSSSGVVTIDVSLTAFGAMTIPAGTSVGYAPALTVVPVGTHIRFINQDSFAHTASSVGGAVFPAGSPLAAAALAPSANGRSLSAGGWSSGNLLAGAASPEFVADVPGTYLFGCFYHYGAAMRGAIVVR